jgi:hypothetical protein
MTLENKKLVLGSSWLFYFNNLMFWFFQNLGIKEFLIPILKKENQNQKNLQCWFY